MSMTVTRADTARAGLPYGWNDEQGALVPPEIALYIDAGAVLERILASASLADLDTTEAGVLWRILSPIANELAAAYLQLARVIQLRSLVGPVGRRAFGPYLNEIGWGEMGVPRDDNVPARYAVTFRGPPGTSVPQGVLLATQTNPPIEYQVVMGTVLGTDGTGGAIVEARTPGLVGNVAAGAISRILTNGFEQVTVTNEFSTPLVAGTAQESDEAYRVRLLRYRRDPPNGANAAQFRTWAEQVPGVGRAQVVRPAQTLDDASDPRRPPPGTVDIYVVGMPLIEPPGGPLASQATVDAVQQWIAPAPPPVYLPLNVWQGLGSAPLDVFAYLPTETMRYAGVWAFRPQITLANAPADPTARVGEIAGRNQTDEIDMPTSDIAGGGAAGAARRPLLAGELGTTAALTPHGLPELEFYWDGSPNNYGAGGTGKFLTLHIQQQAGDPGTLTVVGGWLVARFSDPDQQGLTSVADRVQVFAATPIPLTIDVTVQAQPGWSVAAVQGSVRSALEDYLRAICFSGAAPPVGGQTDPTANDVLYGVVTAVIIGAQGVAYIRNRSLRVNGDIEDVAVWFGDVATLGALNCSVDVAAL